MEDFAEALKREEDGRKKRWNSDDVEFGDTEGVEVELREGGVIVEV